MKMGLKYIIKVILMVFLILSLLIFVNTLGLNLEQDIRSKKLLQVVTMEALTNATAPQQENISIPDTSIIMNKSDAFCENHRGSSGTLEESCGRLTQNNCNTTSCCVWTSDQKCAAGTANGPTFNTDSNGKTNPLDYYYFQNKCYGEKCPKV